MVRVSNLAATAVNITIPDDMAGEMESLFAKTVPAVNF
jgi:hypothetical protein